jgi:hypothetical protein
MSSFNWDDGDNFVFESVQQLYITVFEAYT